MEINIIDRDFNFLGQIDNYGSFFFTKKWHSIGGFELHLHEDTTHADKLVKENIIFTTPEKAYVILYRQINSEDQTLIVKGLELKSYLKRWLVFPPEGQAYYRVNSNIETIMKEYVQATLIRKGITNIVVAPNQNRGAKTVYQSRYKNLAEELEKLSLASGLGWDITLDLDNRNFIFDVTEGQDRTANQDILPPAIFSIEYDNIAEQKLIESKLDYANTAIVAGQGEGVDRKIVIVGDKEVDGLDSYELFVDARDLENANDLPERGQQKLAEVKEIFTFDSRVLTDKNLIYEEDFNLGDLITIQNSKWNVTANRRITELTEIYESSGFRLDIAFGESLPDLIEKIKKVTDTPIAEGGGQGDPGTPGADGVGIEYIWNGTELGIKREDETKYQYVDLQGPQGPQGERGPQGLQGPKGDVGPQGVKGNDGYTPVKGVDYFDGAKGEKGDTGPIGPIGPIGPKGDTGARGPEGPQGPAGKDGSDANVTKENVINAIGYTPADDAKAYKDGSVVMNTNPFGGKQLFINNINNALFCANKRWTVTGNIYNSDETVYSTITDSELAYLFNGNYENSLKIPAGKYAKINITFNGGYFPGYPYGYLYLSHYYKEWCQSAKLRVYCNFEAHGIGWHEYDFVDFVRAGSNLIMRAREPVYAISQMEFIVYAQDNKDAWISQIDYQLDRPGQNEMPIVDKYKQNKLYYNLDMNSNKVINVSNPTRDTDVANKKYVDTNIPTKVSQLTNDEGYLKSLPNHNHTKSQITDMPTKLSQFENDIGAGAGLNIVTSTTEPTLKSGDWWFKEV